MSHIQLFTKQQIFRLVQTQEFADKKINAT